MPNEIKRSRVAPRGRSISDAPPELYLPQTASMELPPPEQARVSPWRTPERITFLLVALVLFYQLILPPVTGLADNWDYIHVLREDHLVAINQASPDRYISYIVPTFRYDPAMTGEMQVRTSEAWLIRATMWINSLVSKDGLYDLRWAGVAHGLIFLAALWLALPLYKRLSYRFRIATLALTAIIFWDPLYVTYYNSFYSDASSLCSFLLASVLMLRLLLHEGSPLRNWIGFAVVAGFFFASKAQHVPLIAPALLLLGFWVATRPKVAQSHLIAGVLLIIGMDLWLYSSVAKYYQSMAYFNTVFTGLLPRTANQANTLRELGINESLTKYIGTNAFAPGGPMQDPAFSETWQQTMSHGKLFAYYLKHPDQTLSMLRFAMDEAGWVRQPNLGNFPPNTGHAPAEYSYAFAWWSNLKRGAFFGHRQVATGFLFLPIIVVCWLANRHRWLFRREQLVAMVMLFSMALVEFLISGLMDVAETPRHLFLYQAITDLVFLLSVATVFRVLEHNRLPDQTA